MPSKVRFFVFLSLSVACLLACGLIVIQELNGFRSSRVVLPAGSTIAGVPAGGMQLDEAGSRVAQVYSLTPVELKILDSSIQVKPPDFGQQLGLGQMLEQADQSAISRPFLPAFWDYLQRRPFNPVNVPIECTVDTGQLTSALDSLLSGRYGSPAAAALPIPGDVLYLPGQPGMELDITGSIPEIAAAMCSPDQRTIEISMTGSPAQPPDPALVAPQLEALIQGFEEFRGTVEVYYQDLDSAAETSFAYTQGRPVPPGIAFTAASTIKIPVMVSVYQHIEGELPPSLRSQIQRMIDLSDNGSTDEVMNSVLDEDLAPIQVTETVRALDLENTFLAGFFYPGAPLLQLIDTPANTRTDISTDPDIYNQTSPADMGRLLAAIQRCADGKGPLIEKLDRQVTQVECQEMITFLSRNKKGVLIENGLPEGTRMARKYGWVTDPLDGLMHSASDAAVVYTSGGNFVLTVYFYHPDQLNWDAAQRITARLATALSNYYALLQP